MVVMRIDGHVLLGLYLVFRVEPCCVVLPLCVCAVMQDVIVDPEQAVFGTAGGSQSLQCYKKMEKFIKVPYDTLYDFFVNTLQV